MIEYLKGAIVHRKPTGIVVSVNGVGYGIDMPLSALCQVAPDAKDIELWIYTHVREDALKLFGFLAPNERALFEILLSVNGIGPRLALAILSTLGITAIKMAVVQEISEVFESVPGIGKRMAEKILVEMKAKLKRLNSMETLPHPVGDTLKVKAFPFDVVSDVQSALENLGFKAPLITLTLRELTINREESVDFNVLLKDALVKLGGGHDKDTPPPKKQPASVTDVF